MRTPEFELIGDPQPHQDLGPGARRRAHLRDLTPGMIDDLTKAIGKDVVAYLKDPAPPKEQIQDAISAHINEMKVAESIKRVFRRRVTVKYIKGLHNDRD